MNTQFLYSWHSRGNLGDDWIFDIADQYVPGLVPVRETRRSLTWPPDAHALRPRPTGPGLPRLWLWGGGWLAADQSGSNTLERWLRHSSRLNAEIVGFGLGAGPFLGDKAKREIAALVGRISTPIYVRCADDVRHLSDLADTRLAADISFLDNRLFPVAFENTGPAHDGVGILSFPRYSTHWQRQREWLTEAYYRRFVERVKRAASDLANWVEFLEFDTSGRHRSGDASYWSYLRIPVRQVRSVEGGLSAMRGAAFVYAGRLHAGLMAALSSTPVAAFAYHHKFRCLDEIGVPVMGMESEAKEIVEPRRATESLVKEVRTRGIACFQKAGSQAAC